MLSSQNLNSLSPFVSSRSPSHSVLWPLNLRSLECGLAHSATGAPVCFSSICFQLRNPVLRSSPLADHSRPCLVRLCLLLPLGPLCFLFVGFDPVGNGTLTCDVIGLMNVFPSYTHTHTEWKALGAGALMCPLLHLQPPAQCRHPVGARSIFDESINGTSRSTERGSRGRWWGRS